MKSRIALIGTLTIVLTVFAISTALATEFYLVPDDSSVRGYGNTTQVQLRINATQEIQGVKVTILYDPKCACITDFTFDPEWEDMTRASYPGEYIITAYNLDEYGIPVNLSVGDYLIGNYTIRCNSTTSCVTDLIFASSSPHSPTWATDIWAIGVPHVPFTTDNGTFTCSQEVEEETFSRDLVKGWNLISLPLSPSDNRTSAVLASVWENVSAVYKFNATSKQFESVVDKTMEPGEGYFVYVTQNCTWTYSGTPYTSMSIELKKGLNMVGWLNCSKDITDALSSIAGDYWYVAKWNAEEQKFEVYNPVAPPVFNDFNTMERGEGYFISMKSEGALTESC